jgi:hypothetical protein
MRFVINTSQGEAKAISQVLHFFQSVIISFAGCPADPSFQICSILF